MRKQKSSFEEKASLLPRERPEVVLDIDYKNGLLFLVLENIGSQPAFDVQVKFSRPLKGLSGRKIISEMRLFRGIALLRPHKEIRIFLDLAHERFRGRQSKLISARIAYRDRERRNYTEVFRHDLSIYNDWVEIVSALESGDGEE